MLIEHNPSPVEITEGTKSKMASRVKSACVSEGLLENTVFLEKRVGETPPRLRAEGSTCATRAAISEKADGGREGPLLFPEGGGTFRGHEGPKRGPSGEGEGRANAP